MTDYSALAAIEDMNPSEASSKYFEKDSRFANQKILNQVIKNNLKDQRSITLEFDSEVEVEDSGLIFLYPLRFSKFTVNPFVQDSRVLPVEFDFPFFENQNALIPIPPGYELDDFPESISVTIPSKTARFSFLIVKEGNELRISSKLDFTSKIFQVSEYADLKYMMETVSLKLNAPIVLRKSGAGI